MSAGDDSGEFAREHTRVRSAQRVKLKCKGWAQLETLYTRDISRGGMFLKTRKPLPVGSDVELTIGVPGGAEIVLRAEVVHVSPPDQPDDMGPGMGIRFGELDDETREQFEGFLGIVKSRVHTETETDNVHFTGRVDTEGEAARAETEPGEDDDLQSLAARVDALSEAMTAIEACDYREARHQLAPLLRVNQTDPYMRAAYHLAFACEARDAGRDEDARKHFEQVLRFDKRCREAIRALRKSKKG